MTYEFLDVRRQDRITKITLNRPEVLNALNPQLHQELSSAFDDFCVDPTQWVCILTGAGRAFCAGSDLKYAARALAEGRNVFSEYAASTERGFLDRHDNNKPVITAVNGPAMGGGFEIALAGDLIVAAESAVFALSEPRVGAVALGGGVHRLARQIGLKQAMGMVLTGRRVTAEEGRRLGFVNEVVADCDLDAAADRWAGWIVECAPLAVRASKQMMLNGMNEQSLEAAMRNQCAYPAYEQWAASEDAHEGGRAFAEHRPPQWQCR